MVISYCPSKIFSSTWHIICILKLQFLSCPGYGKFQKIVIASWDHEQVLGYSRVGFRNRLETKVDGKKLLRTFLYNILVEVRLERNKLNGIDKTVLFQIFKSHYKNLKNRRIYDA